MYLKSRKNGKYLGYEEGDLGVAEIPSPSFTEIFYKDGKWVTDLSNLKCVYTDNAGTYFAESILNGILDFTGTNKVETGSYTVIDTPEADLIYEAAKQFDTVIVSNSEDLTMHCLTNSSSVVSVSKFAKSPDDYTLPYRVCINSFYGKHNSKAFITWYESSSNHSSFSYWVSFFKSKDLHVGLVYAGEDYTNEILTEDIVSERDYLYEMSKIGASRIDIELLHNTLYNDTDAVNEHAVFTTGLDVFHACTLCNANTLKASAARTPLVPVYNKDLYINVNGFNVEGLIYEDRAFDCIINATGHTLIEDQSMLIHKEAYEKAKEFKCIPQQIAFLVENYNTIIIGEYDHIDEYKILKHLEDHFGENSYGLFSQYHGVAGVFKKIFFPKPKMRVTFEMSRVCNANCSYCSQAGNRTTLSDDEQLANLDEAIKMAEQLTDNYYVPQIMGGEPSIWSDKLIDGIIERFKDKGEVIWFTNGTNRNSHFFTAPNSKIIWHVIDWKNKKLSVQDNENCTIIVTHQDVPHLKKFLDINRDHEIYCNICSPNKLTDEYATTVEDVATINTITGRKTGTEVMSEEEVLERQAKCRLGAGPICIDVLTKTLLPCRGPHEKRYSFEEYLAAGKPQPSCEGCLFEYYR